MNNFGDINFNSENTGRNTQNPEPDSPADNKKGWFGETPEVNTAENISPPPPPPYQQHNQNINQPYWNRFAAQNGFNNPGGQQFGGYPGGAYQPGPYPNGVYNQGAFNHPAPPPVAKPKRDTGLSYASFGISIASIVLIWVPALNLILALTALILGIVSLVKGCGGFGIAGVVISSVALFASIIYSLLFLSLWSLRISKPSLEYDFDIGWMMALLPSIFK